MGTTHSQVFICLGLSATGSAAQAAQLTLAQEESLGAGRMYLDCSFDGKPESCFLDTGAGHTFISPSDNSLQYVPVGQRQTGGAAGGKVTCDIVSIERFTIGKPQTLERTNFEVTRCNQLPTHPSTIGIDAFHGKVISLNFPSSELNVVNEIPPSVQSYSLKAHPSGHVSMPVLLGCISARAFFDTGAGLTSVDQSFINQNLQMFDFVSDIDGHDSTGKVIAMKVYRAHEIRIGDKIFRNVTVLGFDFTPFKAGQNDFSDIQFIIGYNLIVSANWYLDLERNRWAIQ